MKFIHVGDTVINIAHIQTITINHATNKVCVSFAGEGCVWLEGRDATTFLQCMAREGLIIDA